MKKAGLNFLMLILIFSTRIFAGDVVDVNLPAKYSFQKEYPGALHASWSSLKNENIYAVRFIHCNQAITAYYDEDGTRIALAWMVKMPLLPVKVQETISRLYQADEIKSIQELVMYNKTCYFFETASKGIKRSVAIFSNGQLKKLAGGE